MVVMGYSGSSSGGLTAPVSRSDLAQEDEAVYTIPINAWKRPIDGKSPLYEMNPPAGEFYLSNSTHGGSTLRLATNQAFTALKARSPLVLRPNYVAGQTVKIRVRVFYWESGV